MTEMPYGREGSGGRRRRRRGARARELNSVSMCLPSTCFTVDSREEEARGPGWVQGQEQEQEQGPGPEPEPERAHQGPGVSQEEEGEARPEVAAGSSGWEAAAN